MISLIREMVCDYQVLEPGRNNASSLPQFAKCHLLYNVLSSIPAAFLLAFCCMLIHGIKTSGNVPLRSTFLNGFRIVFACLIVVAHFSTATYSLLHLINQPRNTNFIYLLSNILQFAGSLLALILTIACKKKGVTTSGVLTIYWFLSVFCGIPELWTHLNGQFSGNHKLDSSIYIAAFVLASSELFLCCFADKSSTSNDTSNTSPEQSSSFVSQVTFQWFQPLVSLGNRRPLQMADLWNLTEEDQSEILAKVFMENLRPSLEEYRQRVQKNPNEATKKNYPSILVALWKTYKYKFLIGGFYKLMGDLLHFVAPQLQRQLMNFLEDGTQPIWVGMSISWLMFLSLVLKSILLSQYELHMRRLGLNIRSVLASAVYEKALKLSNESKKEMDTGKLINYMTSDIAAIQVMTIYFMNVWSDPVQILFSIVFLCQLFGATALSSVVVLIVLGVINWLITWKTKKCQKKQKESQDERSKMMCEILNGIKVLKLYSWEKSMEKIVLKIREKEIGLLKTIVYLSAGNLCIFTCASLLISIINFFIYVFTDSESHVLTAEIICVAFSLTSMMQDPLEMIPHTIGYMTECHESNKRLKEYLAAEEMESRSSEIWAESNSSIKVENGSFSWSSNEDSTLQGITINIKKGQLVAIVGRVGAGKSSLLHALLGEMNTLSGNVEVNGSVSYVPQQAWIQNMSLKNNILFDKPYDFCNYEEAIKNCALKEDLANLPAGDRTEIGEKGINLSGGQKQRVSLARAVYQNSDIVFLDDPLSAVDSHVGKHIFENVISSETGCLRNKTRILVTHGLTYLEHCDQIIVLNKGSICEMGSYQQLMKNNGAFADFLKEFLLGDLDNRGNDEDVEVVEYEELAENSSQRSEQDESVSIQRETVHPTSDISINDHYEMDELLGPNNNGTEAQLIKKEKMETGSVDWKVYLEYIHAVGVPLSFSFLLAYVASGFLGVVSNVYLAKLANNTNMNSTMGNGSFNDTRMQLSVYAGLGITQAVVVFVASIILALGMVRASTQLHSKMLANIMRSPMAFFDVTPVGRILTRFGTDIKTVDSSLPTSIRHLVMSLFISSTSIFLIVWATSKMGFVIFFLGVIYWYIFKYFIKSARQLQRLVSVSSSPISSHFQESIQGASSIRAYGVVHKFIKQSQKLVDELAKARFHNIVITRWLEVRLEMVSSLLVLSAAGAAVYFRDSSTVSAGFAGLSISYALNITNSLSWIVWTATGIETDMVSVEKITEYSKTPTEGNDSQKNAPESWPQKGQISFKNFSLKYREGLDRVLHEISVDILPSEKIGIVGRTGAGKSSLTLALFRIIEADGGSIEIDGINIADLKLEQLRSRLTIVPQDPVLFSGTMRMNLDPFEAHGDDQVWRALENAHLGSFVKLLPNGLNHHISEGGENLSVGQRQLICLARALLRKTKVLVLDEAAAAVDVETDSLIQRTIREQFKDCTVLTIAHRLNTVMDSDRILVFDKRRVAEFDSPSKLLADSNGQFYSMAKDANLV